MQGYFDVVVNSGNDPVVGASVFVYDSTGALATIYSSQAPLVFQVNPITTGADGRYLFYAANGIYTVVITAPGYNTSTLTVSLDDPLDGAGITSASYTAAPNATVNVSSITPQSNTTNADLAFLPKGSGALLAQVPTATAAGGNKRGQYAIDFQTLRSSASQVASGNYSLLIGGRRNTASGLYSAVVGGEVNTATATSSAVVGGSINSATGAGGAAIGGASNNAAGSNSAVVGGSSTITYGLYATAVGTNLSSASGDFAVVIGGNTNSSDGFVSVVIGGTGNVTTADYSTVIGGARGTDRGIKAIVVTPASYQPIEPKAGVSQTSLLVLGTQTTNATATRLTCDGSAAAANNQLILSDNSAVYFRGSVIANVTGGGDTKSWTFDGQIKRGANAASTTIRGTTITSPYSDAGASAWSIALTVDTTYGGLAVTVTGQASTTIRWVCKIETTEVAY